MEQETNNEKESEKLKCPKCGSDQLQAGNRGFNAGKAIGGALLTGGIGILAGMHGSKKVVVSCMNCGNKWKPADVMKKQEQKAKSIAADHVRRKRSKVIAKKHTPEEIAKEDKENNIIFYIAIGLVFLFMIYLFFSN